MRCLVFQCVIAQSPSRRRTPRPLVQAVSADWPNWARRVLVRCAEAGAAQLSSKRRIVALCGASGANLRPILRENARRSRWPGFEAAHRARSVWLELGQASDGAGSGRERLFKRAKSSRRGDSFGRTLETRKTEN